MTALLPRPDALGAPETFPRGDEVPEPTSIWLTNGNWPLHGSVHEPAAGVRGAVVLCSPLFGEQFPAQPLYRALGQAMAEQGLLALRFDYEGTGDSGGPSTGAGRIEAWLDGAEQAAAVARELAPGPIAFLGVRSGALVAAAATERRAEVDVVALWDPWRTGRSFLRREHALHALRFRTPPDAAQLDVSGFAVDEHTVEELAELRLPPRLRARRALLVVRPGTTLPAFALESRRGGSAVRTAADVMEAAPGEQEALFEADPLRRRVPEVTVANVVHWMADVVGQLGPRPGAGAEPDEARSGSRGGAAHRAGASRAPVLGSRLVPVGTGTPDEPTVYERAVRIGPHGLFGIESVQAQHTSPAAPVALFFPSGMDFHIGPNRFWVTLARRWAALGVRSIRVDLSGLGESPPRPGRPGLVVRAPEAFDDVADVVDAVGGPERVVLVGLCSSAYQALESAIELGPLGVLAMNPVVRFSPPELAAGGPLSSRRRLCQPRANWEKRARRVLPGRAGRALAGLRRRLARWGAKAQRRRARTVPLALAGVDVHILCGEFEAQQLATFGLVDVPGSPMRVDVLADLAHSLEVAAHREEVADRLTAALRTMVGSRLPAGRVGRLHEVGADGHRP